MHPSCSLNVPVSLPANSVTPARLPQCHHHDASIANTSLPACLTLFRMETPFHPYTNIRMSDPGSPADWEPTAARYMAVKEPPMTDVPDKPGLYVPSMARLPANVLRRTSSLT